MSSSVLNLLALTLKDGGVKDPMYDVEFKFAQLKADEADELKADEADELRSVHAHKMVLAWASPILKEQFFGPLGRSGSLNEAMEVILVEDASLESFQLLIQVIYAGNTELLNKCKDFQVLFSVLRLSDKYEIEYIFDLAKQRILTRNISSKNVFSALQQVRDHQDLPNIAAAVADQLLNRCAAFMMKNLKDSTDVFEIWWLHEEQRDLVVLLFNQISQMKFDKRKKKKNKGMKMSSETTAMI